MESTAASGIPLLATTSVLLTTLLWAAPAFAREEFREEGPPPTTVEESPTSMDYSFVPPPTFGHKLKTLKEKLKDAPPFIRDMKLDVNLRTFYMFQEQYDSSKAEAWALGGSLTYRSGYLLDHLAVGAEFYTSQPLYAPSDRPGTLLLSNDQHGYSVLGQLYGEFKIADDVFVDLYRKEYNTPFINARDNRMTPNTFEAYTLMGAHGGKDGAPGVRYGLGYFTHMKPRNGSGFQYMSRVAGASVDRGVFAGGANYLGEKGSLGAVDYYCDDVINIFYTEGKILHTFANKVGLLFAAQYTDQRSTGDDLLTGSSFFTNQFGIKGEVSYEGGMLSLTYTVDSKGDNLRSPWSGYPGYTAAQVQDYNRAGEEAFLLRLAYDFARVGVQGLTGEALWVHAWNRVAPETGTSLFSEDEFDLDLQWRPKSGLPKGFWPRVRYAHVERSEGLQTIDDVRVIINYEISVL